MTRSYLSGLKTIAPIDNNFGLLGAGSSTVVFGKRQDWVTGVLTHMYSGLFQNNDKDDVFGKVLFLTHSTLIGEIQLRLSEICLKNSPTQDPAVLTEYTQYISSGSYYSDLFSAVEGHNESHPGAPLRVIFADNLPRSFVESHIERKKFKTFLAKCKEMGIATVFGYNYDSIYHLDPLEDGEGYYGNMTTCQHLFDKVIVTSMTRDETPGRFKITLSHGSNSPRTVTMFTEEYGAKLIW